ncbi:hypothetical protein PMAYCL1PPCAC_01616, partial [Pristionchus mayeri]
IMFLLHCSRCVSLRDNGGRPRSKTREYIIFANLFGHSGQHLLTRARLFVVVYHDHGSLPMPIVEWDGVRVTGCAVPLPRMLIVSALHHRLHQSPQTLREAVNELTKGIVLEVVPLGRQFSLHRKRFEHITDGLVVADSISHYSCDQFERSGEQVAEGAAQGKRLYPPVFQIGQSTDPSLVTH